MLLFFFWNFSVQPHPQYNSILLHLLKKAKLGQTAPFFSAGLMGPNKELSVFSFSSFHLESQFFQFSRQSFSLELLSYAIRASKQTKLGLKTIGGKKKPSSCASCVSVVSKSSDYQVSILNVGVSTNWLNI